MTFLAEAPSNISESILGGSVGSSVPVARPVGGPASGILSADPVQRIIDTPSKAGGSVCISRGELIRRTAYNSFQGLPSTAVCFPYVLSDTVPSNKYRVVFMADLQAIVASNGIEPSLFLVPPGPLPNKIDGSDSFFLSYIGTPNRNYGPPKAGIRVDNNGFTDQSITQQVGQQKSLGFAGDFFIVPPGWTLLGYDISYSTTGLVAGAALEMRLGYVDLDLTEDFTW